MGNRGFDSLVAFFFYVRHASLCTSHEPPLHSEHVARLPGHPHFVFTKRRVAKNKRLPNGTLVSLTEQEESGRVYTFYFRPPLRTEQKVFLPLASIPCSLCLSRTVRDFREERRCLPSELLQYVNSTLYLQYHTIIIA